MRLLLGMAEAGFFPGVIYYLTLWFPAHMRARAVSRFYIALPLSSVVMGSLAGWLMGLQGKLGLAGWQWLFLVEGLPAALFSFVILRMLPDGPAQATWLTRDEKIWLRRQLEADSAHAHLGHEAGVLQALLSPKVWMIGLFFFCALTCSYGYGFSAPAILQGVDWLERRPGRISGGRASAWLVRLACCFGGAVLRSHRRPRAALHRALLRDGAPAIWSPVMRDRPWLVVAALGISFVAFMALQGPALAVPTQFLAGRAAAAGIAAMNTITMFSGFVGPYWMGVMKDQTGSYWLGLRGLVVPSLVAALAMFVLTRSLARTQAAAGAQPTDLARRDRRERSVEVRC